MSLLLEALNRSESERKQQETMSGIAPVHGHSSQNSFGLPSTHLMHPGSHSTAGSTIINTGNQTPWFLVVLCFNALLFVVAGFFWIQLENQKSNNDTLLLSQMMNQTPPAITTHPVTAPPSNTNLAQLVMQEAENQLALLQTKKTFEITPEEPIAMVNVDGLSVKNTKQRQAKHANITTEKQNVAPPPPFALKKNTVYTLNDLPVDYKTQFPKLTYNAHLYSPDVSSARMIMANDTKYNEKDFINPDLQIDQITPQGVIYRFKEAKLRVDVVSELQ